MESTTRTSRQEAIADAVLTIAGREGIGSLTMERLAREVGVTAGALFRHFPSRDAMLDGAAARAAALLESTFPPGDLPPLERLGQLIRARSALAARHAGIPQLVFSEQFAKALPPEGARAIAGVVRRTVVFVIRALEEARERGEVRGDVPAETLATVVIGTVLARALLARVVAGELTTPPPEEAWRDLLRLLRPGGSTE